MIDSHCHLAGEEFAADLESVVARARDAGVTDALCILAAGNEAEAAQARLVHAAWPSVRFAVGIHPHQAGEWIGRIDEAVALVRRRVGEEAACAIGEIGLDYHYDFSPREIQQELFTAQVQLARQLGLPIIIHTREATPDTFDILRGDGGAEVQGVFHCFTGDEAMARAAIDIDFYVSFAGILTFPRAVEIRQAARIVPSNRLLTETDSPYLAPVPLRGKRNEPAHVVRVVEKLAEVRSEPLDVVVHQVAENFEVLFGRRAGEHPSGPSTPN
jgi:TatD DNase family protein